MDQTFTFGMVKPNVIEAKQLGEVISQIEQNNFIIESLRYEHLHIEECKEFYAIHKDRPFYEELCHYIASSPVVVMQLKKKDAVAEFRKLIGATNPAEAAPGTIRQRFGKSILENAIHGSDSEINAAQELSFFFGCACC